MSNLVPTPPKYTNKRSRAYFLRLNGLIYLACSASHLSPPPHTPRFLLSSWFVKMRAARASGVTFERRTVKKASEAVVCVIVHPPSMTSSPPITVGCQGGKESGRATRRSGARLAYDELPLKRSRRDSSEGSRRRKPPLCAFGGRCTRPTATGSCARSSCGTPDALSPSQ